MQSIVITKGGDRQQGLRIAKHPRARLSDYTWRAEVRTAPAGELIGEALTSANGRIVIASDLKGDLTLIWGRDETEEMAAGSYVLDLRAVNKVTGVVEFTDIVTVVVRQPVTQAA